MTSISVFLTVAAFFPSNLHSLHFAAGVGVGPVPEVQWLSYRPFTITSEIN